MYAHEIAQLKSNQKQFRTATSTRYRYTHSIVDIARAHMLCLYECVSAGALCNHKINCIPLHRRSMAMMIISFGVQKSTRNKNYMRTVLLLTVCRLKGGRRFTLNLYCCRCHMAYAVCVCVLYYAMIALLLITLTVAENKIKRQRKRAYRLQFAFWISALKRNESKSNFVCWPIFATATNT